MKDIFSFIGNIIALIFLGIVILFVSLWVVIRPEDSEPNTRAETCEHQWSEATCTESRECDLCGEKNGEPLGHYWMDATFYAPKTCVYCGETKGKSEVVWPEFLEDSFTDEFTYAVDDGEYELVFAEISDARVFMEELHTVCTMIGEYWSDEDARFTLTVESQPNYLEWIIVFGPAPRTAGGVHTLGNTVLETDLSNELQALYNELFVDLRLR